MIVAAIEGRVRWVGGFELVMLAHVLKVAVPDLLPKTIDRTFYERAEE